MKKIWGLFFLVILLGACGGRGVYLYENEGAPYSDLDRPWLIIGAKGVGSKRLEQRLCQQQELKAILQGASLSLQEQEVLFQAACGANPSAVKFLREYYRLTEEKRLKLRKSFERHGFSLNDYGC